MSVPQRSAHKIVKSWQLEDEVVLYFNGRKIYEIAK